jgi:hypothetical protein
MLSTIDDHIGQLIQIGTDRTKHRNGTLLQHLQGVWTLLKKWNNPESICLAGLYHSVYSTGGFEQQLISLTERNSISQLIGDEAEQLTYLFCACDRPITHPRIGNAQPLLFHDRFTCKDYPLDESQWRALCEITVANELDLGLKAPAFYRKHAAHYGKLFGRFEPWLSSAAIHAHHNIEQRYL